MHWIDSITSCTTAASHAGTASLLLSAEILSSLGNVHSSFAGAPNGGGPSIRGPTARRNEYPDGKQSGADA